MRCVNEPFGIGAFQTGQAHPEISGDAESPFGAWTNADSRGHGGIRRNPPPLYDGVETPLRDSFVSSTRERRISCWQQQALY
jgi:hypothetical protein